MAAIESIKIEIHRKKDNLKGKVKILCTNKEVLNHDIDDAVIWIIISALQRHVASIKREE